MSEDLDPESKGRNINCSIQKLLLGAISSSEKVKKEIMHHKQIIMGKIAPSVMPIRKPFVLLLLEGSKRFDEFLEALP